MSLPLVIVTLPVFRFDHHCDAYVCPGGKDLQRYVRNFATARSGVYPDGFLRYRASKRDCDACALKQNCCPGQPARKIPRSIHEGARDMARDLSLTDAYVTPRRERKKVQMLFAPLKRILTLDRLPLPGPHGATHAFLLADSHHTPAKNNQKRHRQ